MYGYLAIVKNKKNMAKVTKILNAIFATDILTEEFIKEKIRQVKKLKEIEEDELYEIFMGIYRKDPDFKKYLN